MKRGRNENEMKGGMRTLIYIKFGGRSRNGRKLTQVESVRLFLSGKEG